jgi:hypothetical protein
MTTKKTAKKTTAKRTATKPRPVLVTTEHRGVFFGYASNTTGSTIKLSRGRNVLYWSADCHGFIGLAKVGPMPGSKVGPAADIEVRAITSVVEVTPEAVVRFEAEPWAR